MKIYSSISRKVLTICLFGMIVTINAFGQTYPCGTKVSPTQVALESTIIKATNDTIKSLEQLNKTFSLSIFVVNESNGSTGLTSNAVSKAISFANQLFIEAGISFEQCEYFRIPNYQYNFIQQLYTEKTLLDMFPRPNRISVFIGSTILDKDSREVCGYTYFPADNKDVIMLSKHCLDIDPTLLAHELLHLFNLYETHEVAYGKELADGSNANSTGDLCKDTPADPNIFQLVDEKCNYTAELKDANGKFYSPSVRNVMSFSRGECRCSLTIEQKNRVIYAAKKLKNYLW